MIMLPNVYSNSGTEEDSNSAEEVRRRRLQRFGSN